MKGLIMKTILRSALALSLLVTSGSAFAVSELSFDGPKETYYDNGKKFPVTDPGNFDVWNFKGTPFVDVAVPTFRNFIQGLDNQNNWASVVANSYFLHNYVDNLKVFIAGRQVVKGNFNADAKLDALVVGSGSLGICYDYDGGCPGGWSDTMVLTTGPGGGDDVPATIMPIAAVAADFDADTRDDVAVIGWSKNADGTTSGWFVAFKGTGAGGADPLTIATPLHNPFLIPEGLPLSIVAADADGDGDKDVLTGQTHVKHCDLGAAEGAFLMSFLNTGSGANPQFTPNKSEVFTPAECSHPTGLISVDPDANNKADPIVTCYYKVGPVIPAAAARCPTISGNVRVLKGQGNGIDFNPEQTLEGFDHPATTTAADYNKDGFLDLAVAEHKGKNVVTYAGKAPYQVYDPGNRISTSNYMPLYIQSHDVDDDTYTDIVLTANDLKYANRIIPTDLTHIARDTYRLAARYADFSKVTADTALYSNNADFVGQKLGEAIQVSERQFNVTSTATSTNVKAKYAPFAARKGVSQVNYIVGDLVAEKRPTNYLAPPVVAEVKPVEGVLVLVNNPLGVSIDDPNCDTKEVTYRCTAGAGKTIVSCDCTTTDTAITCGTAAAVGSGQEWTGKVTVPDDNNTHTFTVTGTDNSGTPKVVTAEYTVDLSNCPTGPGACPAKPLVMTTWAWFPITVCPEQSLLDSAGGKAIEWVVTSGPANIGFDDGSGFGTLTLDGSCLTGTLGNPNESNYIKEVRIDGYYNIKDFAERCPFTIIGKPVEFRGTGVFGCSLGAVGANAGNALGLALLAALPMAAWFASRARRRR